MAEVIDTRTCPEHQIVARAVHILEQGGLVAMPTDTVYGLAASAVTESAVLRIFQVKRRPRSAPLPLLAASSADLTNLARQVPQVAEKLARHFWPGPLTIVVLKSPQIPDLVTAGQPTVAVRVPDYPLVQAILAACGFPVAVTSANLSGQPALTRAEQVADLFADSLDLRIAAPPCPGGVPSTVIDVTTSPPRLLRPGPIDPGELEQIVGPLD